MALVALALVVSGAYDSYPHKVLPRTAVERHQVRYPVPHAAVTPLCLTVKGQKILP